MTLTLSQSTQNHFSTQFRVQKDTVQENGNVQLTSTEATRNVIVDLLSQAGFNMPYSQTPYDQELHDLCIRECNLKKYPIDKIHGNSSIAKYIPLGVVITSTAYGHLKSRSIQVFVALYTAFNIWVEDTARNAKGVETFNERFVSGEKQANEGFHGFDRFLRETNIHYHGIQAHVIVTTTLFYMSSISLEIETQGTPVSPHAKSEASFIRAMSRACDVYVMFIFPPELPVTSYVQAVPDLCLIINHFNDVLTFNKKSAGENGNYLPVEPMRKPGGKEKILVFKELARDLSLCVSRIADILEDTSEAKAASKSFISSGYVLYPFSMDHSTTTTSVVVSEPRRSPRLRSRPTPSTVLTKRPAEDSGEEPAAKKARAE